MNEKAKAKKRTYRVLQRLDDSSLVELAWVEAYGPQQAIREAGTPGDRLVAVPVGNWTEKEVRAKRVEEKLELFDPVTGRVEATVDVPVADGLIEEPPA